MYIDIYGNANTVATRFFIVMQIQLAYKKPRMYVLTPSRKPIGKAVARGSRQAMAVGCFNELETRKYLLKHMGVILRNELKVMCSDNTSSILQSLDIAKLKEFSWDKLLDELKSNTPVFLHILQECTRTRKPRPNQDAVVCVCAAILLKHRFAKMSLLQRVLSLILYAGHSGKQVCWGQMAYKPTHP